MSWFQPRKRLWAIYQELGYIPWRKPQNKQPKQHSGVYIGTREAIPFMNDDAKRTLSQLLLRPGYMMRDYILRGQHERYLAPLTALLVFYSVFTFIVAVVQPGSRRANENDLMDEIRDASVMMDADSTVTDEKGGAFFKAILLTTREAFLLTHLDQHPEAVDTPWKESLAAVESDMRSKGVPLFLGNFLGLWAVLALLLRKKGVSISGAAAASGYILCQFCIFMFLALLTSLGQNTELGVLLMGLLLFIDYRQMLGIGNKEAIKLTLKTGLVYTLIILLFYLLLGILLVSLAILRT